jgi:hypothetical protein
MTTSRRKFKKKSNNKENPNQNVCANAVANYLGVDFKVRYLHTITDIVRAVRKRWTVRSRKSSVKGKTVGSIRKELENLDGRFYMIRTQVGRTGHVILLDKSGKIIIDTAPVKRDKRKFTHLYAIY